MSQIWKKETSCKLMNQRNQNTLSSYLDISFIEIGDDYVIADMPIQSKVLQPKGILHGGASCALIETVASTAADFTLSSEENKFCVGLEINVNHIRMAKDGKVNAKASPLHVGKKTQVWQVNITQTNKRIAIGRITLLVIDQ